MAAEIISIPTNGTRLSALAQALSQNADVEDAYIALLGAVRLTRSRACGNSILVTSTAPGEGKTTVASCLAITAALAGQTVLLIDGDLRRSSLASALGIADSIGLTEILCGETWGGEGVHALTVFSRSQRAARVNVMAGGKKSAIILTAVDWPKARTSFGSIAQKFDLVLVDSPPILAANDALLLAGVVDGILLVVGAGSANRDELRRAKGQLEQSGAPLLGAVLNRFEPGINGQSSQPYRGYYRRSNT